MTVTIDIACLSCRHHWGGNQCEAFPGGIPEEILFGDNDHTEPYPGDHDIQYEPAEEEE